MQTLELSRLLDTFGGTIVLLVIFSVKMPFSDEKIILLFHQSKQGFPNNSIMSIYISNCEFYRQGLACKLDTVIKRDDFKKDDES